MKISYSNIISWQKFDDFIFIINEVNHKQYTMKDTNMWFWQKINEESLLENIVSELYSQVKDVKYDEMYQDFVLLTKNLENEGLLVVK